jgi:hypothetical protein
MMRRSRTPLVLVAGRGTARQTLPAAGHPTRQACRIKCARGSRGCILLRQTGGPTPPESDIVVCLEAIARALHSEFQPRALLGFRDGVAMFTIHPLENAAWLGIRLDAAANLAAGPRITIADSPVSVWVVPTNEELMIARHTLACTHV